MQVNDDKEVETMVSRDKLREGFTPHAFGNITLYTKMESEVQLEQLEPNYDQPRHPDRWESRALRHQIVEVGGLFEPLLAEPTDAVTPDSKPKYVVLDGHRRLTELKNILAEAKRRLEAGELTGDEYGDTLGRFGCVAVEVTHRPLSREERVRVWLLIHRERREWTLQEKEATAKQLIDMTSVREAARFLGVTEPAAQKLADIYDVAQRINLHDDLQDRTGKDARITWAREIRNLKAPIREDDEVIDSVLARIRKGTIHNSKDIRVLREIYPQARDAILDSKQDLVRDIAQPMGVDDPVRSSRRRRPIEIGQDADFTAALNEMANAINKVTFEQLQEVQGSSDRRSEAKSAVERMIQRLNQLADHL